MAISNSDRARQFLPFDALEGFREALRKKEIEYIDKKELSEEQIEEICNKINELEKEDEVEIIYYKNKRYEKIKGIVEMINYAKKKIILFGDNRINFSDILKINKN